MHEQNEYTKVDGMNTEWTAFFFLSIYAIYFFIFQRVLKESIKA